MQAIAAASHNNEFAVEGIKPVDGWRLFADHEQDGDGFWTFGYTARRGSESVSLNVSRFSFHPTQDRFDWLACNGFPPSPGFGPWSDLDIDRAIAASHLYASPPLIEHAAASGSMLDDLRFTMAEIFAPLVLGCGLGAGITLGIQALAVSAS